MKITGIISEYNPFHNGHKYHIEKSKELICDDTAIVAVMSGNFTQRGEPAMFDKWTRAELAVLHGVDLVIELPFISSCGSAEQFAKGGIRILNGLGCIDYISFGSECGNVGCLNKVAVYLSEESTEFSKALKKRLNAGISYPKARAEAVEKLFGNEYSEVLNKPNNILAIEYLKQLHITGSSITPITVKRKGTGHSESCLDSSGFASALSIRKALKEGQNIRKHVPWAPFVCTAISTDDLYEQIAMQILKADIDELADIVSINEGFENRLKNMIRYCADYETLVKMLKTKRYTRTRLQRILIHVLMNLTEEKFYIADRGGLYARILAFNDKGSEVIKQIKKSDADIKIITNVNKDTGKEAPEFPSVELDIKATDIYNLATRNDLYENSDFVKTPFIGKNDC